jgi:tetratricopeptide (TPR) repeat protein
MKNDSFPLNLRTAILVIFLGVVFLVSGCTGQAHLPERQIFEKANTYYKEGDYAKAILEYEKIKAAGYESGSLYYNLGNCHYKMGSLSQAILNYERAKRLMPRDSDLRFNYASVKAQIPGYALSAKRGVFSEISDIFFRHMTINELAVFQASIFILTLVMLSGSLFWPRIRRWRTITIALFAVLFLLGGSSCLQHAARLEREAIVLSKDVRVKFAPVEKATVFFELIEGMKVEIVERKQDWSKIRRCDGKIGWVVSSCLEII